MKGLKGKNVLVTGATSGINDETFAGIQSVNN